MCVVVVGCCRCGCCLLVVGCCLLLFVLRVPLLLTSTAPSLRISNAGGEVSREEHGGALSARVTSEKLHQQEERNPERYNCFNIKQLFYIKTKVLFISNHFIWYKGFLLFLKSKETTS